MLEKSWKEELLDYFLNKNKRSLLTISNNSEKIMYADIKKGSILISSRTIEKIIVKHNLNENFIKRLDEVINSSVFAFESFQYEDSKIFVTQEKNKNNYPIIFTLREDTSGYISVNIITSIYDKKSLQTLISNSEEKKKKFYLNPKKKKNFEKMGYKIKKFENINILKIKNNNEKER